MPKYLDHGIYPNIGATPTWGVAQEGDGTAIGLATPAIVSIDLSAATAAAGATFSIMGAVLTCVASGAGANQFNAGSGATLVASLVAAINRSANTNTCTAAPHNITGWATPVIQNTVFARIGTPTTLLEIMTRGGSSSYNAVGTLATAGFTGGTFGPYTFSGGVGGAWGCLINGSTTALGSALPVVKYGAWGANKPVAGAMVGNDLIEVRSAKTITVAQGVTELWVMPAMGGADAPVIFRIDDSSVWSDGANPQLKIQFHTDNWNPGLAMANGATFANIIAKKYSDTHYGLKFCITPGSGATPWPMVVMVAQGCMIVGLDVDTTEFSACDHAVYVTPISGGTIAASGVLKRCRTKSRSNSGHVVLATNVYDDMLMLVDHIYYSTYPSAHPNVLSISQNFGGRHTIVHDGCRFVGFVANSNLMTALSGIEAQKYTFINCDFGNVSLRGPYVSGNPMSLSSGRTDPFNKCVSIYSQAGGHDFSIDACSGSVEWNSSRSYPYCNAKLLDGVTGWSILATPTTVASLIAQTFPLNVPRIAKLNTLEDGDRVATVEIAAHEALTEIHSAFISVRFEYTKIDGSLGVVDTFDPTKVALSTSTTSWSNEVSGQVYYPFTAQKFNKYKLSATLLSVKTGSEIGCFVFLHGAVVNNSYGVFIDPEITLV